jgi:hypothetical protein
MRLKPNTCMLKEKKTEMDLSNLIYNVVFYLRDTSPSENSRDL